MQTITTTGLDTATSVFQVRGIDAGGQVIVRRQLKRRYVLTFFQKLPPCLVGVEACGSAHHWSRELQARMPPAYPWRQLVSSSPKRQIAPVNKTMAGPRLISRLLRPPAVTHKPARPPGCDQVQHPPL